MAMVAQQHRESSRGSISKQNSSIDSGKYVRYTAEQVEALERVYTECPKPSSLRRQQLIRECPILSNIEPKQIKVWFQNRRYERVFMLFVIQGGLLLFLFPPTFILDRSFLVMHFLHSRNFVIQNGVCINSDLVSCCLLYAKSI